jgi:hypothetical protein
VVPTSANHRHNKHSWVWAGRPHSPTDWFKATLSSLQIGEGSAIAPRLSYNSNVGSEEYCAQTSQTHEEIRASCQRSLLDRPREDLRSLPLPRRLFVTVQLCDLQAGESSPALPWRVHVSTSQHIRPTSQWRCHCRSSSRKATQTPDQPWGSADRFTAGTGTIIG